MKNLASIALAGLATIATPVTAQNLLVNGDFEASASQTTTPPGWTNVGHSDGVIAYSVFNTPAYDGDYFYDLGGYGDPNGPVGDGIQQTVSTTAGQLYNLTFGLTSENAVAGGRLDVFVGDLLTSYDLAFDPTFGTLAKPFATQNIAYTATGGSTLIRFLIGESSGGNNDPMIDGVFFVGGIVPEPATWGLMILGIGAVGGALRRRNAVRATFRIA